MVKKKIRVSMIGGGLELRGRSHGARIRGERLYRRHLGSIHMAFGAEIARMTRRARRGNAPGSFRNAG
jgi:hypothetical protein